MIACSDGSLSDVVVVVNFVVRQDNVWVGTSTACKVGREVRADVLNQSVINHSV